METNICSISRMPEHKTYQPKNNKDIESVHKVGHKRENNPSLRKKVGRRKKVINGNKVLETAIERKSRAKRSIVLITDCVVFGDGADIVNVSNLFENTLDTVYN
ncbi:hypothetical protein RRG08_016305 [Elysia crispata]|uniref:Uncharacterized protein n=1 Tax=Elysia crispata TaxID=231223 RepID=A0AAE0ZV72_9GAST|nr:hypothetical protein RRG08_016305 [Elysia crispata]